MNPVSDRRVEAQNELSAEEFPSKRKKRSVFLTFV